jgi:hypothetical protein
MSRRPYFHTLDRVQVLLNQLHLWQGTRWRHSGARPSEMNCGVSGDCLFWVHAFKAIGALPAKLEIPDYRLQEARADEMQTLRSKIEATGRALSMWERPPCRDLELSPPLPIFHVGDVLLFKNGTSGAHCGLVVKEAPVHFAHLTGNGLLEEPLQQKHYLGALTYVYRLLEPAIPSTENPEPRTANLATEARP